MTKEDMIRMAREAGWEYANDDRGFEPLWRFAKLVRDDYSNKHAQLWLKRIDEAVKTERQAMMQLFTDPENQPTQHGTVTVEYMQREIEAEREACAKLLEDGSFLHDQSPAKLLADEAAKAIRARDTDAP